MNDISVLTRVSITTPSLSVSVNPHDNYYRSVVQERPPPTTASISHMTLHSRILCQFKGTETVENTT